MAELDNKISNIIGAQIPSWVLKQLETRSRKNASDSRDTDNVLFVANKTAWIRLVSSIDVQSEEDLNYFTRLVGEEYITDSTSLAKNFILFGGTSRYLDKNSYKLRSGLGKGGAYGMLGDKEIQDFGYRPMPGITSVTIDTQGRLGSVRAATINFKCWDKDQLDIIDALYFKLGFTMFLEWGHTFFYPNPDSTKNKTPDKIISTELYSIDPFQTGLTKEDINVKISQNSRDSEGNYDAMLGMVTNFNFSYNQDGGFDCTLKLLGLGYLGDSIKINNSGTLPSLLEEEILRLNKTLIDIEFAKQVRESAVNNPVTTTPEFPDCVTTLKGARIVDLPENKLKADGRGNKAFAPRAVAATINAVNYYFYKDGKYQTTGLSASGSWNCLSNVLYINGKEAFADQFTFQSVLNSAKNPKSIQSSLQENYYFIKDQGKFDYFAIDKFKNLIPIDSDKEIIATLNFAAIEKLPSFSSTGNSFVDLLVNGLDKTKNNTSGFLGIGSRTFSPLNRSDVDQNGNPKPVSSDLGSGVGIIYNERGNLEEGSFSNENYNIEVEYSGINRKPYSVKLEYKYDLGIEIPKNTFIKNRLKSSKETIIQDTIKSTVVNNQTQWKITSVENTAYKSGLNANDNTGTFIAETILEIPYNSSVRKDSGNTDSSGNTIFENVNENIKYSLTLKVTFSDLSILSSLSITDKTDLISPKDAINPVVVQQNLTDQNQTQSTAAATASAPTKPDINAIATQIKQSLNYQSSLEIMLRTIQVHALNKAINKTGAPDLDIGKTTYVLNLWDPKDKVNVVDVNNTKSKKPFLNQIFSSGIFSSFIDKLVNSENINDSEYTQVGSMNPETRFIINSKYGFATSLMGNKAFITDLEPVNFKELLKAYVVPYQINQEIIKGTTVNHPVYITLGQLLMILNHACTIYDTKKDSQFQTPLIYIDFNPELNFCLTNKKQLSTDPWTCLIPFEGSFEDFKTLFDRDILSNNGTFISSKEPVALFNPETQDLLSGQLPKLKFDEQPIQGESTKEIGNVYRGKLMNILLNIDYLVQLVQQYSHKDGSNAVYLKTFLEQVLTDVNKSLGNFNAFRLSYNDLGNTYQIVDDQIIPTLGNERQLTALPEDKDNITELPLLGKYSIAKSLEIKSEISSKLSNMLAISANSTIPNKATLSTNGDSFGFINTNFIDRYITDRLEPTGSNLDKKDKDNDTLKTSAAQFNSTISDFYSKINPSQTTVAHATNYYIEKMATLKNDDYATRASFMIPVSVNLTTDGISGFNMGQAFSIPDKLLPYTYSSRKTEGFSKNRTRNVGFVAVGLTHKIENNQWDTSIRANMIFLKNKGEFNGKVERIEARSGQFGVNASNISVNSGGTFVDSGLTAGAITAGPVTKNVNSFEEVTKQVIANLEGGYFNPIMFTDGRLSQESRSTFGRSGETMFGIDRVAGGTINTSPAGLAFWKLIDDARAATTWRYNFIPQDPLKTQILNAAIQVMKPVFEGLFNTYVSKEIQDIVKSDGRLYFNFIYATWNGPGYFEQFSKQITLAFNKGQKNSEELLKVFINLRLNSRIFYPNTDQNSFTLINKGGKIIARLVGVQLV